MKIDHHRAFATVGQGGCPDIEEKAILAHGLPIAALRTGWPIGHSVADIGPGLRTDRFGKTGCRRVGAVANALENRDSAGRVTTNGTI